MGWLPIPGQELVEAAGGMTVGHALQDVSEAPVRLARKMQGPLVAIPLRSLLQPPLRSGHRERVGPNLGGGTFEEKIALPAVKPE